MNKAADQNPGRGTKATKESGAGAPRSWLDPIEAFCDGPPVRLCYEDVPAPPPSEGGSEHPRPDADNSVPILLIMGLACQMTVWPPEFLEALHQGRRRIIRFDNRDIGHSGEIETAIGAMPPVAFARYQLGLPVHAAYKLHDMAEDVIRLVNHLALPKVHLVGVSMGGMISQIVAARHSRRVASLTLVMTSDNSRGLPSPSLKTLWAMSGAGVRGTDREAALQRGLVFWRTVASPGYDQAESRTRMRLAHNIQRSYRPEGVIRQMQAIMATGSLAGLSKAIDAPTLILHGLADPLVRPEAARVLARHIPHATLHLLPGWGHDLPVQLAPRLAELVLEHCRAAEG